MGYDIFEEINRLSEVVNDAVATGDYSNLRKQVGEIVEPMKKQEYDKRFFDGQYRYNHKNNTGGQNRYQSGRNRYQNGSQRNYNAGHMENRGNAFYGTYAGGNRYSGNRQSSPGTRYGSGGHSAGTGPRQNTGMQTDPLKGETELFKRVENSLVDQIKQILGIAGAVVSGFVAAIMLAITVGFLASGTSVGVIAVSIVFSLFSAGVTAAFVALAMQGRKGIRQMQRYVKYRSVLMKKSFASVKELAEETGAPEDQVVKELKELTNLGFFKQGHFDKKETTFICADEVYRLYQQSEESERIRQQEEAERKKQAGYIPEDVRELLDKGNEYVRKIHEANDKIPGEEVSKKLDRMENIVARIFTEVQKNPSLASNLNMFMDYYLPTTTKLMDAYVEMDANPMQGENIQKSKREIEATLDTINDAYENLLDSFFRETALDVSTDISVMKNMMRQQGLTPDDLEMIRRKQQAELAESPNLDELEAYAKRRPGQSSAPTLENVRQQLAEEDAKAGRKPEQAAEEDYMNSAPTLEQIRRQLAEEDAKKAQQARAEKAAAEKAKKAREAEAEKAAAKAQEKPLSFDEQLELEAQQGLLMTGNGDDDDIF